MKTLIRLAVVAGCLGVALIAAPQYTPNNLPYNYGNNKLGICYNSTLNNWINILPTSANTTAYPIQCDQNGNMTVPTGSSLPLAGGTLNTNAAIAFQGTGAATTLANLKGVTAITPTVTTDLATFNGTAGQLQDSGIPSATVATVGTPTVGHASCIKSTGPVVIGYCSSVVASDGTCTCN